MKSIKDSRNQWVIDSLSAAGLSPKATLVYYALLEFGTMFPSTIAQYTNLNRSTVYHTLQELVDQDLVGQFEKNKKYCYQVQKPKNLLQFIRRQINTLADNYSNTEKIMPELEALRNAVPQLPRIHFFEGPEGVENVYRDHIEQAQPYEMVGYSNVGELQKFLSKRFFFNYVKAKARLKITSRGIFPDTYKDFNYNQTVYRHISQEYWPLIKHIESDLFSYKIEISMYGTNRVSIVNFHEYVMVGIIIEDVTIHRMMRMIFDLVWNSLPTP